MRALVCDDQAMVRAGIRLILESQPDIEVVGEAADGEQAVAAARRLSPDVVLMDIRMPRLDGIEATRRICSQDPCPAVIVLTTFGADEYVYEALRAGASGFMLKDSAPEQLVATLRLAALGDALVTPLRTRALIERHARPAAGGKLPGIQELTPRETEVLVLIARGLDNGEMGARLHLSEATIRTHVGHILAKLQARSRVQAVVAAYESGLVQPGS
jgi:DNA-binding NarL/FixJ family response regulator